MCVEVVELGTFIHSRVHHHRRGVGQARGLPELLLAQLPALQPAAARHGEEAALSLCRVCCLYEYIKVIIVINIAVFIISDKLKFQNSWSDANEPPRAREDALVSFVSYGDISNNSEDVDLERSKDVHPLAKRLAPEQAITVGNQV